ncbi:MAG: hypothetical protein P9X26_10020, partial [Candidatus Stygibacter frigidus]|nr:hypothetical protein [Candidatus Stygibacter frigidus]
DNTYFFFSSQRKTDDPTDGQQSGDIYCLPFDWDSMNAHHFNFISTAFSEVRVRRYMPTIRTSVDHLYALYNEDHLFNWVVDGDNMTTAITYGPFSAYVHNTFFTFAGAVDTDRLELMGGVYTENVAVDADVTIDGNKVAEINPVTGYSFELNNVDNTNCTIEECMIMDGIQNNGSGTVTAAYNYWGEDIPTDDMFSGTGTILYIPWYSDENMTTLAYPTPDVTVSYDGSEPTISWTGNYPGASYTVYGSDDPTNISNSVDVANGQVPTLVVDYYQYYAVTATVSEIEYTNYAGKAGYTPVTYYHGYNYLPVSMDYGFTDVLTFATLYGTGNIFADHFTVNKWDVATQGWISVGYTPEGWDGNFAISVGDVLIINDTNLSGSNSVNYSGTLPSEWATFDLVTTSTTDLNLIYLPLNETSLTSLSLVGSDIGLDNCNTLSIWDASIQQWSSATYLSGWQIWINDGSISTGQAIMLGALQNFDWPD